MTSCCDQAVPGASRSGIAGVLGDRLKVRISAPPEAGKANDAICELIAQALASRPGMCGSIPPFERGKSGALAE